MQRAKEWFRNWEKAQVEAFLFEKILGSLAMAAIGDALGMPAHDMTREEIGQRFGGPLRSFRDPFPDSRVHKMLKAGQITDDTLLTLATAQALIDSGGKITPNLMGEYLFTAVNRAFQEGLDTLFGQSTKAALKAFNQGQDPIRACRSEGPLVGATNGGAMRIAPIGLTHPGDIPGAVRDTVIACLPTHGTQTGIAAACAVAGGLAEALNPGATVFTVVQAALRAAEQGEELGKKKGRTVPLPSVPKRIRLAVALALNAESAEAACRAFAEVIGLGLPAYESVPTALGIFLVCEGDPVKCVLEGANIGNDTDTIASMAGALAGAFRGIKAVPRKWLKKVEQVNHLSLADTAQGLSRIALQRLGF